jgi:hypothetical protein
MNGSIVSQTDNLQNDPAFSATLAVAANQPEIFQFGPQAQANCEAGSPAAPVSEHLPTSANWPWDGVSAPGAAEATSQNGDDSTHIGAANAAAPNSQSAASSDDLDAFVSAMLSEIDEGWSEGAIQKWVYETFLDRLSGVLEITRPALTRHLDDLIQTLKDKGHKPRTLKQYWKIWKSLADQKLAEQVLAKKHAKAVLDAAGKQPERFVIRPVTLPGAPEMTPPLERRNQFSATGPRRLPHRRDLRQFNWRVPH